MSRTIFFCLFAHFASSMVLCISLPADRITTVINADVQCQKQGHYAACIEPRNKWGDICRNVACATSLVAPKAEIYDVKIIGFATNGVICGETELGHLKVCYEQKCLTRSKKDKKEYLARRKGGKMCVSH